MCHAVSLQKCDKVILVRKFYSPAPSGSLQISLRRTCFASSSLIAISKTKKKKHLPSCVCIASNEWCVSGGEEPMRPDEINSADWLEDNQAPCLEVTVSLTAASRRYVFCFNGSQMGRFSENLWIFLTSKTMRQMLPKKRQNGERRLELMV